MQRAAALAATLMLAGCGTFGGAGSALRQTHPGWPAHQREVLALDSFVFSARAAVQATDRGASARLRWRENGTRFSIRFEPPVGTSAFEVRDHPEGVQLTTQDGRSEVAGSAEALVAKYFDVALPVSGVRYWVRGAADPDRPVTYLTLTEEGLLKDLEQDRWRVSVLEYTDVDGTRLPRRLFLARDDVQVRIVVDRWRL